MRVCLCAWCVVRVRAVCAPCVPPGEQALALRPGCVCVRPVHDVLAVCLPCARFVCCRVTMTMLCGQARNAFAYRRPGTCYDMFGVDVMFDGPELDPYILELNLGNDRKERRDAFLF